MYCQKKSDLYKANDAARKMTKRERWKYLEPKKYKRFKKKEAAHVREYRLKKHVRAITTQYWNVNGTNNTNHVISILNKTNFKPNYPHD